MQNNMNMLKTIAIMAILLLGTGAAFGQTKSKAKTKARTAAKTTVADPDPNTGGPALKRSDQQTSSVHQIESRPVEPVHGLIDECGNV